MDELAPSDKEGNDIDPFFEDDWVKRCAM
jgi:hypothetical protein